MLALTIQRNGWRYGDEVWYKGGDDKEMIPIPESIPMVDLSCANLNKLQKKSKFEPSLNKKLRRFPCNSRLST